MQTLSKFSQENVLCLLIFDELHFSLARHALSPELFDSPYREVATKAINYIDRYNQPAKEHIADEIEGLLSGDKGTDYQQLLLALYTAREERPNYDYIIERLTGFIRNRQFEEALYTAADLQNKGRIDEAQEVMDKASSANLTLFDPGIKITDLHFLAHSLQEDDIFPTGIAALDAMKVGPARKQVLVFLAPKSKGKSWFQIHMARTAIILGLKVAHITLEISKEVTLHRYIQNFLGLTRWRTNVIKSPLFIRDGNHDIIRLDKAILNPRSLDDTDILEHIEHGLKKFSPKAERCLRIKEFPPGMLTEHMLTAYLDGLERAENFIPDIVIIDPAYNMKIAGKVEDLRVGLGRLFVNLRGLSVDRNFALSTSHQINRAGSLAKVTMGEHIAEDWSILGTVDTGIIYNQRIMEERNNIARLWVDRARSMRSRFFVLITQNYDIGQFCMDSQILPEDYDPNVDLFGNHIEVHPEAGIEMED